MQRVTQLIFLIVLLSAITQSVQSQDTLSSGGGNMNYKTAPTKPVLAAEQIAQRFLPGVALIICDDGKGNYSQGSGFFIAPGMILTNAHVVKGMVRGVVLAGGQQKKNLINAVAYFNSENTDLALLVSDEAKSVRTPVLPLAKPNDLRIGETIYVLSNPEGLVGTISQGIVSSGIRQINKKDLLQISASISAGSSGGAVMNSRGEVVGIATSSLQSGQNLNFAVPSTQISMFIDKFVAESKKLEYILAGKFTNSWYVPKSFLSQPEIKKTSPTVSREISPPSFQEITQLISNKLVRRSFVAGKYPNESGELPFKTERIIFDKCHLFLEQKNSDEKGTRIYIYHININFVKDTYIYPRGSSSVSLILNNETPFIVKGYRANNYDLNNPDFTKTSTTEAIIFATDNQASSELIEKAFKYTIELCKESTK